MGFSSIDRSGNKFKKREQVPFNLIAQRNGISPQYLEQVFASLRKAGLVKSVKGSQGGYFSGEGTGENRTVGNSGNAGRELPDRSGTGGGRRRKRGNCRSDSENAD